MSRGMGVELSSHPPEQYVWSAEPFLVLGSDGKSNTQHTHLTPPWTTSLRKQ